MRHNDAFIRQVAVDQPIQASPYRFAHPTRDRKCALLSQLQRPRPGDFTITQALELCEQRLQPILSGSRRHRVGQARRERGRVDDRVVHPLGEDGRQRMCGIADQHNTSAVPRPGHVGEDVQD